MKTAKRRCTWIDEYRAEIQSKDSSELFATAELYENQALPSERTQECAIAIRAELNRRMRELEGN
jgi:hypothetical protein